MSATAGIEDNQVRTHSGRSNLCSALGLLSSALKLARSCIRASNKTGSRSLSWDQRARRSCMVAVMSVCNNLSTSGFATGLRSRAHAGGTKRLTCIYSAACFALNEGEVPMDSVSRSLNVLMIGIDDRNSQWMIGVESATDASTHSRSLSNRERCSNADGWLAV